MLDVSMLLTSKQCYHIGSVPRELVSATQLAETMAPKGRELATAARVRQRRNGHKAVLTCHVFFDCGQRFVYAGRSDGIIQGWRCTEYYRDVTPSAWCVGHAGQVTCMVYLPEYKLLATGSHDRTIKLWDITGRDRSKQCVQTLRQHGGAVTALWRYPPHLFSASRDGKVIIWRSEEGRGLLLYPWLTSVQVLNEVALHDTWITAMSHYHNSTLHETEQLIVGDDAGNVTFYVPSRRLSVAPHREQGSGYGAGSGSSKQSKTFQFRTRWNNVHSLGIAAMRAVTSEKFLVTIGFDNILRITNLGTQSVVFMVENAENNVRFTGIEWNAAYRELIATDAAGYVAVYNVYLDQCMKRQQIAEANTPIWTPHYSLSTNLLSVCHNNGIQSWKMTREAQYFNVASHQGPIVAIVYVDGTVVHQSARRAQAIKVDELRRFTPSSCKPTTTPTVCGGRYSSAMTSTQPTVLDSSLAARSPSSSMTSLTLGASGRSRSGAGSRVTTRTMMTSSLSGTTVGTTSDVASGGSGNEDEEEEEHQPPAWFLEQQRMRENGEMNQIAVQQARRQSVALSMSVADPSERVRRVVRMIAKKAEKQAERPAGSDDDDEPDDLNGLLHPSTQLQGRGPARGLDRIEEMAMDESGVWEPGHGDGSSSSREQDASTTSRSSGVSASMLSMNSRHSRLTRQSASHDFDRQLASLLEEERRAISGEAGHDGNTAQATSGACQIYSAGLDNRICCWDSYDMSCQFVLNQRSSEVSCLHYDHNRNFLVSGCEDGSVTVWNPDTGTVSTLRGHANTVTALASGTVRDRPCLLSAGFDGRVCVWDVSKLPHKEAMMLHSFAAHTGEILTLGYNEYTSMFVTGGNDKLLRVWTDDAKFRAKLDAHTDAVTTVAFDANFIFSGSEDCTIRIWDSVTFTPIKVLQAHQSTVRSIIVIREYGYLVSCSYDGHIYIWNYALDQPVKTFRHRSEFTCLTYAHSRREILAGTTSHKIFHFPLPSDMQHQCHSRLSHETAAFLDKTSAASPVPISSNWWRANELVRASVRLLPTLSTADQTSSSTRRGP